MCVRVRALFCSSGDRCHGRAGKGIRPAAGGPRPRRSADQSDAGQTGGDRRRDPRRASGPPSQVRAGRLHRSGHGRRIRARGPRASRARDWRAGQQRRAVVPPPRVLPKGRRRPVRRR